MNRIGPGRVFGRVIAFGAMVGMLSLGEVKADQILNTLTDAAAASSPFSTAEGVAELITIGPSDITLTSVILSQKSNLNTNETFSIYASNATLASSPLFADFTQSFNGVTGYTTEAANSNFVLAAGSSYYFYMNGAGFTISVDTTTSATSGQLNAAYASIVGGVFTNDGTNFQGLTSSQGVEKFEVNGLLVPEPTSLSLVGIAGLCGSVIAWRRRRAQISA